VCVLVKTTAPQSRSIRGLMSPFDVNHVHMRAPSRMDLSSCFDRISTPGISQAVRGNSDLPARAWGAASTLPHPDSAVESASTFVQGPCFLRIPAGVGIQPAAVGGRRSAACLCSSGRQPAVAVAPPFLESIRAPSGGAAARDAPERVVPPRRGGDGRGRRLATPAAPRMRARRSCNQDNRNLKRTTQATTRGRHLPTRVPGRPSPHSFAHPPSPSSPHPPPILIPTVRRSL